MSKPYVDIYVCKLMSSDEDHTWYALKIFCGGIVGMTGKGAGVKAIAEIAKNYVDNFFCSNGSEVADEVSVNLQHPGGIECKRGKPPQRYLPLSPEEQDEFWKYFSAVK